MNEDKASRYHRLKRRSYVLLLLVSALFLAVLMASGASVGLSTIASTVAGGNRVAALTVFVLLFCLAHELVTFPAAAYSGFILERRYGLSRQHAGAWLRDRGKALLIEVLLGMTAAHVVYYALDRWPSAWWAISALVFATAGAALAGLAPILLLPVFYRFAPLQRESLRDRLVALSKNAGIRVLGVYEWGLGQKTRRANAALVGTGATRRILVSDTLLAEYSDDEIEVILAHEIAHHVHRDILVSLAADFVVVFGGFAVAAAMLRATWRFAGLQSPADMGGMPIIVLSLYATSLATAPLLNALSRWHERRADRYALELTRRPEAFISAMRRLAAQNLAEEQPSRVTLWLFHTHPPFEERIATAKVFGN